MHDSDLEVALETIDNRQHRGEYNNAYVGGADDYDYEGNNSTAYDIDNSFVYGSNYTGYNQSHKSSHRDTHRNSVNSEVNNSHCSGNG